MKTVLMLVVVGLLVLFACDQYRKMGGVDSLKQGVRNIQEAAKTRGEQLRLIDQELDKK